MTDLVFEQGNMMNYSRALFLCALGRCECSGNLKIKYDGSCENSGEVVCKACEKSQGRFKKLEGKFSGPHHKACHSHTKI